jgi:hypothetical protein
MGFMGFMGFMIMGAKTYILELVKGVLLLRETSMGEARRHVEAFRLTVTSG